MVAMRADLCHSEAIYFDAYLPGSKRPVRIDRVQKSTTQLIRLFSKCPYGLPIPASRPSVLDSAALFDISGQPHQQKHYPLQPPFLVPAVIDALKANDTYRDMIHLVPGEADDFCARHTFKASPACILTSDSDLLVHDLPEGTGVVFLRDIYTANDDTLSCALFTPADIAAQFEVPCTRLAYERARLPQATVNQLRRVCLEEEPDEDLYRFFCRAYVESEKGRSKAPWNYDLLDPRLSELVYQLFDGASGEPDMFLPTLTENHSRRSAWEPSLALRSIAYVFAAQACRTRHKSMREHRKIQNISQHKGTSVKFSKRTARLFMDELLLLLKRCARYDRPKEEPVWLLVCLVIDVQDHVKSEKRSPLLEMLQQPPLSKSSRKSKLHSWELVHAAAHIFATLYSLRLVDQILRALPSEAVEKLPEGLLEFRDQIARVLPPLVEIPDVEQVAGLLRDSDRSTRLRQRLGDILDLALDESESEEGDDEAESEKQSSVEKGPAGKKSNNPFDLLSADD